MMILQGVIIPLVTPLTKDEKLDENGLRLILRYMLDSGVHGIFMLGSTGEFPVLDEGTKQKALEVAISEVNGRLPVLAGITSVGTRQTLENLRMAQDAGVDAVVLSPGYYYPHSQDEVLRHYETICNHTEVPIVIYNVPSRVRTALELNTVATLAQMDSIMGIKDSSCDFHFFQRLLSLIGEADNFAVLQGDESTLGVSVLIGASGIVPGIGNLDPVRCVQLYNFAKAGEIDATLRLQKEILELTGVFSCGSPYGGLKAALHALGLTQPYPAAPASGLSQEELERIHEILRKAKLSTDLASEFRGGFLCQK